MERQHIGFFHRAQMNGFGALLAVTRPGASAQEKAAAEAKNKKAMQALNTLDAQKRAQEQARMQADAATKSTEGLSTTAKVVIGFGAIAVLGGAYYFMKKKS